MAESNNKFDVAVLGAGPGGYPAAIRAAQNGARVALIEREHMGGTCLNWGCIPTKTLIANAETLHRIEMADELGINVGKVSFDFAKMADRKDDVVSNVRNNLEQLIKSNNITIFRGRGEFLGPHQLQIAGEEPAIIEADNIVIATGSRPREIDAFPFDEERILSSDDILSLKKLPKSLAIIGGGVIGCEFASLYHTLGVEVTILELLPTLIATEAPNVCSTLTKSFERRGIKVLTGVMVEGIENKGKHVMVNVVGGDSIRADMALVAVGRSLNTENIGLDKAGIATGRGGEITVDESMATQVPGIYAIGDITGKWQLAHVASHQGIVAANNATGHSAKMRYNAVPSVIFTNPEIGSVGLTLEQAIEQGHNATLGSFPFTALGKAQAALQTDGFGQIVIDKNTGQLLGAQVVGHEAATLVAEMGVAIANELTVESITDTIHAHPTIAEVWLEAAMMANDSPLHLPPKPRKTGAKS